VNSIFCIGAIQVEDISEDALMARHGVEFAKELQRLQGFGEEASPGKKEENRRFTIMDLEKNGKKKQQVGSLAMAFERRFTSMDFGAEGDQAKFQHYSLFFVTLWSGLDLQLSLVGQFPLTIVNFKLCHCCQFTKKSSVEITQLIEIRKTFFVTAWSCLDLQLSL
jgi:hypothetical protein